MSGDPAATIITKSGSVLTLGEPVVSVPIAGVSGHFIQAKDISASLAQAAEGFQAWDVLDAAHMLVASLIVDLVQDGDRSGFLRKMDRVLRDRVREIGARQEPRLVV